MAGTKVPLTIEAKAYFAFPFQCQDAAGNPVDITGYSFKASIKAEATDTDDLATFAFTITGAATGDVLAELFEDESTKLNSLTAAVWDLKVYPPGAETAGKGTHLVPTSPVKIIQGVTD